MAIIMKWNNNSDNNNNNQWNIVKNNEIMK